MLNDLYKNIGGKIKEWAKWIFIVEAIGAVITGIYLICEDFLYGVLILIFGPIVAYVGSWILYAFGEMAEDIHAIRNEYSPVTEENTPDEPEENAEQTEDVSNFSSDLVFICPKCKQSFSGKGYVASDKPKCPDCKVKTRSTGINKHDWLQMTKEDRINKIQETIK